MASKNVTLRSLAVVVLNPVFSSHQSTEMLGNVAYLVGLTHGPDGAGLVGWMGRLMDDRSETP